MNYFTQKRRLSWLVLILIGINALSLGLLWFQNQRPKHHPPSHERAETFLQEKLDLRPDQLNQVRELRATHFRQMVPLNRRIHQTRQRLFNLLKQEQADSSLIENLSQIIGAEQAEREHMLFMHLQDIKNLCDPEQQRKFEEVVEELIPKPLPHEGPPGRRPPHGPPPRGPHRPPPR